MPTGHTFPEFHTGQHVGRTALQTDLVDRSTQALQASHERLLREPGLFARAVLGSSGNDEFDISPFPGGIDGTGSIVVKDAGYASVPFPNATGTDYYVALKRADYPVVVEPNPRTGVLQYVRWQEAIGYSGTPTSVTDLGSTLRIDLTSILPAAIDQTGREVMVWLDSPASADEAVAIQTLTVARVGGKNVIETADHMGQSTPSVTAADYTVMLVGPLVAAADPGGDFIHIGVITGNGPAATPTGFDVSGQVVFASDENIGDLFIVEPDGTFKLTIEDGLGEMFNNAIVLGGAPSAASPGASADLDIAAATLIVSGVEVPVDADTLTLSAADGVPIYVYYDPGTEAYAQSTTYPTDDAVVMVAKSVLTGGVIAASTDVVDMRLLTRGVARKGAIYVGDVSGAGAERYRDFTHFATLGEAFEYLEVIHGAANAAGRPVPVVEVVGPCVETQVPLRVPCDGLTVIGRVARDSSTALVQWGPATALFDINGKSGFTVRDLEVRNTASTPNDGAYVATNTAGGTWGDLLLERVVASGAVESFLVLTGSGQGSSSNVTLAGCRCATLGRSAILVEQDTAETHTNWNVLRCVFTRSWVTTTTYKALLHVDNVYALLVDGCQFVGAIDDGVYIDSCQGVFLRAIYVTCAGKGVHVTAGSSVTITNASVTSTGGTGVQLEADAIEVDGLSVSGAGDLGLYVTGAGCNLSRISVSQGGSVTPSAGVTITGADCVVNGLRVSDHAGGAVVLGGARIAAHGVIVDGVDLAGILLSGNDCTISGVSVRNFNRTDDAANYGIWVTGARCKVYGAYMDPDSATSALAWGLYVAGSHFVGDGIHIADKVGVYVGNASARLRHVTVVDSGSAGLQASVSAADLHMQDCTIQGASFGAIFSGVRTHVRDCYIVAPTGTSLLVGSTAEDFYGEGINLGTATTAGVEIAATRARLSGVSITSAGTGISIATSATYCTLEDVVVFAATSIGADVFSPCDGVRFRRVRLFSSAGSLLRVQADDFKAVDCVFDSGGGSTPLVSVTGDDVAFEGCYFARAGSSQQGGLVISGERPKVLNCRFYGANQTYPAHYTISVFGGSYAHIEGNEIQEVGTYTGSINTAQSHTKIVGNVVRPPVGAGADFTKAVVRHQVTVGGVVADNFCGPIYVYGDDVKVSGNHTNGQDILVMGNYDGLRIVGNETQGGDIGMDAAVTASVSGVICGNRTGGGNITMLPVGAAGGGANGVGSYWSITGNQTQGGDIVLESPANSYNCVVGNNLYPGPGSIVAADGTDVVASNAI